MESDEKKAAQDLIQRIGAGDKEAFRTLIEKYQRLVINIVFRMITNANDREDVCQDIFLRIYNNLSGFRFQSKLSTWIAQIAYNRSINFLQKKKIPLFHDTCSDTLSIENISDNHNTPDRILEEKDIMNRLQHEIDQLSIPFRTILTLYHLQDMSYLEISRIMNLPVGTVKSHLFRARKSLKEGLLSKYNKEELCTVNI